MGSGSLFPVWAAGPGDQKLVFTRPVGIAPGKGYGVDDLHAADKRVASGFFDLANDIEWPVIEDFDADSRVLEIIGLQHIDDFAFYLAGGLSAGLDLADQGQR